MKILMSALLASAMNGCATFSGGDGGAGPSALPVDPGPPGVPKLKGSFGMGLPVIYDDLYLRFSDKFAIITGMTEDDHYSGKLSFTWTEGPVDFRVEFYAPSGALIGESNHSTKNYEFNVTTDGAGDIFNVVRSVSSDYTGLYTMKIYVTNGPGKIYFWGTVQNQISRDPFISEMFNFKGNGTVLNSFGRYY